MAKSYHPIGTDCAVVFECANGDFNSPIRVRIDGADFGRELRTEEIGQIASYCSLAYRLRTGKLPIHADTPTPLEVERFPDAPSQPSFLRKMSARYFYHPESECLMKTEDGTDMTGDEVVEIDEAKFNGLMAAKKKSEAEDDFDFDLEDDEV